MNTGESVGTRRGIATAGLMILAVALVYGAGCARSSTPTTVLSEKEKAQFKGGGPMPPEAMEHIRQLNAESARRMQQSRDGKASVPPSAAAGPGTAGTSSPAAAK